MSIGSPDQIQKGFLCIWQQVQRIFRLTPNPVCPNNNHVSRHISQASIGIVWWGGRGHRGGWGKCIRHREYYGCHEIIGNDGYIGWRGNHTSCICVGIHRYNPYFYRNRHFR